MPSFKSLKEAFSGAAQQQSFENGTKKADVTTRKGFLTSSYTIKFSDSSIGLTGEQTGFSVLSNCTERGVKKGKEFCGLK
jgi:hypothetical protein